MSSATKERLDDLKHEVYKEAIYKRREQVNDENAIPGQHQKYSPLNSNQKARISQSPNHVLSPQVLSPNKEFISGILDSNTKFDSLKQSAEFNEFMNNQNISSYLNNSAEKHLNYSKSTISFRQSINVDNLISICTKKLNVEPLHKKALFIRSSSYMKKGLYNQTIKDYPQNVGAYYTRGCAYEKLGDIDLGIADFTKVLELDPNHVNAAFARGACQNRKGDFAKAIEDYNMALEKDYEKGSKKNYLRRSANKIERSESTVWQGDFLASNEKQISNFQSPKMDGQQQINPFLMRNEEDFLNPDQNNNNFMHIDNSQLMTNDFRNPQNMNSTTRSNVKILNEDTISSSSEFGYQDSAQKMKERKPSETTFELLKRTNGDPKDPKAQAELFHSQGFEYRKKGDFQLAIEYYSKALEIFPSHFKALFNRGFAYDKLEMYDLAIGDYTQAIKLDPKNAFAYYNRGISLDRKNEYDDAIKNFTIAISLEPTKADFYHNRGFAYRKKKNFHQAIIDYSKAIELDPNHFKAYYNRAFCYDKVGDLRQAEFDYKAALKIQPKNTNALHHIGTLMEKIGGDRLEQALEYFNQVLTIDNSYAPSYNGRGLVWDKLGHYENAVKDFTKAMNLDSNNPVFIHNRACCLRNMGKLEDALIDFDRAIVLDDKNPIIYSNIGLVWRKLENYGKAIESYTKELFFSKESHKTFNNRAYCYAKLGKYKESVSDYTNALSIDPRNIHSLHNRGICYERLGLFRNVKAIEDFSTVITLNKNNANAYFNRGCCYDSIGELDLAIADYSLALEIDSRNSQQNKDKIQREL